MKVQLFASSVIFLATIWLEQVGSANMDYRYKPRGPPRPSRQPPPPHYFKKWEQNRPSRNTARPPRPIPLEHIPPNFLQPQAPALLGHSVLNSQIPVRNIWQNQNQIHHQPLHLPQPAPVKIKKEKPFQFSQQINNVPEYDYQIQTNTIPSHTFPIKQVGEKGPIHTIPAPNLSPADRPAIIEEQQRPAYSYIQQGQQLSTIPNLHSYQVTEPNDHLKNAHKNFRDQQVYFSTAQAHNYKQQPFGSAPETPSYSTNIQDQQTDIALTQHEIYQLINAHLTQKQQEPQQLYNHYDVPLVSQTLVQQPHEPSANEYNALLGHSQIKVLQPHPQYQMQKTAFTTSPQLQMYNYERHADSGAFPGGMVQGQTEPFIQEIFDVNDENLGNGVESKSDIQDKSSEGAVYYTSLPNRQAAETLASLQTAGKSNVKQDSANSKTPLEIYVPDTQEFANFEVNSSIRHKKDSANPDDFEANDDYADNQAVDEYESDGNQESQRMFGKRLKPKQKD
ncbi:uncharacterized protein LOC116181826 [Photinus pyralis]|nr:uncharacterized protein LOC116166792 [Photinus pyralis]XP_031358115.1 uncharacterized protein LOC116181826 [Photinus pyralis]